MASGEDRGSHQFGSYRDLEVWQLGMDLAEKCYRLTMPFPREEMFGLTSQIRRAASSVPFNISEGWGRDQTGDVVRFLRIANGSLKEIESAWLLSERLGFASSDAVKSILAMTDREGRMPRALIRSLGGE